MKTKDGKIIRAKVSELQTMYSKINPNGNNFELFLENFKKRGIEIVDENDNTPEALGKFGKIITVFSMSAIIGLFIWLWASFGTLIGGISFLFLAYIVKLFFK